MEYGKVVAIDKKVSKIVLGHSAMIDIADKEASFKFLDDVYALGVNTFDTAALYSREAEAVLTEWVATRANHDEVVILSKCGHCNKWRNRLNAFDIRSDMADFLAKPGADYVDIYMLHRDDESVAVAEIIECFNEMLDKGYIKSFGASNWSLDRVLAANEYADKKGLATFTSISPQFSLVEQQGDLWPGTLSLTGPTNAVARRYYQETDMPIFAYSSIARGFLSGKFHSSDVTVAKEILSKDIYRAFMCDANVERLKRAEQLAEEKGVSVAVIGLAWVLDQPLNTYTIITTTSVERMAQNVAAVNVKLTENELKWLNLEINY
ncbi:aldo/keto reductase [Candidatus Epulonipiscium viviparus]|uniref:aldo/keto reductase n=1 Tax=Candidatus Epulonipiscium viviparus TaxID=420336 RepID=UPI0027380A5C|nr:aldo/keto reductase [Candidatus Epulopiscium viviparus]